MSGSPVAVAADRTRQRPADDVAQATGFEGLGHVERRQRIEIGDSPSQHLYVYTPEDILLQKLRWFRIGNEMSDRQWRDILGILLVQGDALDQDYLQRGAESLGVVDLLTRAVAHARP